MAGARGLGGDCEWWEVGGKGGCSVELGGRSEATDEVWVGLVLRLGFSVTLIN